MFQSYLLSLLLYFSTFIAKKTSEMKNYIKTELKKLPVYKLKKIAQQWGLKGLKQPKSKIVKRLFLDPYNSDRTKWIDPKSIGKPDSIRRATKKQSKKRKKLRKEKKNQKKFLATKARKNEKSLQRDLDLIWKKYSKVDNNKHNKNKIEENIEENIEVDDRENIA